METKQSYTEYYWTFTLLLLKRKQRYKISDPWSSEMEKLSAMCSARAANL